MAGGAVPEWTVGDRLRKAREVTGLDQRQFAERLGVSRQTITNAEKGHVAVRRITLNAWALATGVSVAWLETGVVPSSGPERPDGVTALYPFPLRDLSHVA